MEVSPQTPRAKRASLIHYDSRNSHDRRASDIENHSKQKQASLKLSAMTWDVFVPPPINSVKGKISFVNVFKKRRKISVEVHRTMADNSSSSQNYHDQCFVRILVASTKTKQVEEARKGLNTIKNTKNTEEMFKSVKSVGSMDEDFTDDQTIATVSGILKDTGGKEFDGWKPKYSIPASGFSVKKRELRSVFVVIEVSSTLGGVRQERELIFDTEDDAERFCDKVEEEKELEEGRIKQRLRVALGGIRLQKFETSVSFLVEIISCWDIKAGDITGTSDPIVVCMLGKEQIHKTDVIFRTLDPIYTIKTGSLFCFSINPQDLFLQGGLSFLLEDRDDFTDNDLLGIASLSAKSIYKANGERMEVKFNTEGYIAIRCRRATKGDEEFMKIYKKSRETVVNFDLTKSKANDIISIISRKEKKIDGVKHYKVRPYVDPKKFEQEWMTAEAMEEEIMKPSRHWVDTGTGELGKIHLEILECVGLPNLDVGGLLGNKTDAFVAVVYEDTYVKTDTINDCLSPRWLPWTNRAFTLRMAHPSSQIFVGVFDYDGGVSAHDLIGKVSIDITNLKKDTEYILSYNLYESSRIEGRKSRGIVRVRLRIEIPDERSCVITAIEPPVSCHINVEKKKDFRVVRQTCLGAHDYEKFSFHTLQSYINELRAHQHVTFYLEDALKALILWHGHFPCHIGSKKIMLPLHSLSAFLMAVVLVENPQYFPSFFFAIIAWILLAVGAWRNNSPNVWGKCTSYGTIARKLILGNVHSEHSISKFENWEETKAQLDNFMRRLEQSEKYAAIAEEKAQKDAERAQREEQELLQDQKDLHVNTKVNGVVSQVDPVGRSLLPLQLALGMLCRGIRFVKNVLIWEESYYSFWVVTACLFLSITCFFVPWFFLLRWGARMCVWTIFGPWLKLANTFLMKTSGDDRDISTSIEKADKALKMQFKTIKSALRIKRETAQKTKRMKEYLFGRFSMKVPVIKLDRYADVPLPDSTATPWHAKEFSFAELAMEEAGYKKTRKPGQTLVGDMIPSIETPILTVAPAGHAVLNQGLLSSSAPGVVLKRAAGSTASAYVKIGSIVAIAGVFTLYGVPMLAICTEYFLAKL